MIRPTYRLLPYLNQPRAHQQAARPPGRVNYNPPQWSAAQVRYQLM
jgi:hypothetical protein